ncbi:hypothetical protein MUP77_02285 [Candidatus Bathyarchaeota archaeon]|nr:hypothetical protein [Candidatus Bathyarchaeota archaeon]
MRKHHTSQISVNKAISKVFQKGKSQVPLMVRLALKISDNDKLVWYQQDHRVFVDKADSIMGISYVFGGGKTHIPADVGRILGSKDGDRLLWKLENGKIVVELA